MEDLTITTSLGPLGIWGGPFDPAEPLVLFIGGAFVAERPVPGYARLMPGDFAVTHLPGMHSPYFAENSVESFAEAIDEAVEKLGHSRVLLVGQSLGGLVALGMKHEVIEGRLLLDTPLSTGALWPITYQLRERARSDPQVRQWIDNLLGIKPDQVESRDYRHLLQGVRSDRTWLLKADEPLGEPRELPTVPSLISDDDLAEYLRAGLTYYFVRNSGHNLAVEKADATAFMIGQLCERLWSRPLRDALVKA